MSTLNGLISAVVQGDDVDVNRSVTNIPFGQLLTKAWLTLKLDVSTADPGLVQKTITPSPVSGQGQITDSGASGTGAMFFQLTAADTNTLPVGKNVHYDVKVLTSAGKIYTAEQGNYVSAPRITTATS